jgi:hypothetical protein
MTDLSPQSTALTTASAGASSSGLLANPAAFEHTWRVAKAFSMSQMVPPHFQGKPENCMVALLMAEQLEVNHLLALQNLTVIQGRPGFNAQFAIALANRRGPFAGPITWESKGKGDALEVSAKAVIKSTGEAVSVTVSMEMAKAEGWTKNPKYRSIPEQMLRYRSATWLIRLYCPEVLLGFGTSEELDDMSRGAGAQVERVTVTEPASSHNLVSELNAEVKRGTKRKQAAQPTAGPVEDALVVPVADTAPLEVNGDQPTITADESAPVAADDPF